MTGLLQILVPLLGLLGIGLIYNATVKLFKQITRLNEIEPIGSKEQEAASKEDLYKNIISTINDEIKRANKISEDDYKSDKKKWIRQIKWGSGIESNWANRLIGICKVSIGGTSGTIADPKLIFASAILANACGIILTHDHPSGTLRPSQADIALTKKAKEAGVLLDITVLDHLIVTEEGYFSFADEGLI